MPNREIKMDNLSIIRDALSKYRFVGIRGLGGVNADKKYRKGQYLKKSYDLWDDAKYNKNAKSLPGTSALLVTEDMADGKIFEIIARVRDLYGDKICVIAGDYLNTDYAFDYDEVLISNEVGFDRKGAQFIAYLD